jgi:superfamily I DNA/RNA helicase
MQFDAYQEAAISWRRGTALVAAAAGCHRSGQQIMLFDGTAKAVEAVVVGDLLMGPDSKPRQVLQLIRGRGEMARIVPVKGEPFVVNLDHILTLQLSGWKYRERGNSTQDVKVRDVLSWPKTWQKDAKLFRVPIDTFQYRCELPIDPYFMGVLLGDGSFLGSVSVSKPGPEIKALCDAEAQRWGLEVRLNGDETNPTWALTSGSAEGKQRKGRNPLINILRDKLGLWGLEGGCKFVPYQYRVASIEARRQIIAGLIDTDGHISGGGCDFISKSKILSRDFAFLCRSVGLAAYVVECEKHDQNGQGGTYWRVSVSGDLSVLPMRIKKAPVRKQCKDVLRTGFTMELLEEEEEFYGFTLDGDGRYLLGDFTVTHNSGKSSVIVERQARLVTEGCHPNEIITLAFNTSAAEELRARLATRLGPELAANCHAYTFHAFCLRVMRYWFPDWPAVWRIVGSEGVPHGARLAVAALKRLNIRGEWRVYLKAADLIRELLIDITAADACAQIARLPIAAGSQKVAGEFVKFCVEYQKVKQDENCIDFADMLFNVCCAIRTGAPGAQYLGFRHVQTDESQDLSPARMLVARHLARNAESFMLVGDYRQSLYSFAGSRLELLDQLRSESTTTTLALPTNYRSTGAIVDFGNRICQGKKWHVGGDCCAAEGREVGPAPQIVHVDTAMEEANAVAEAIELFDTDENGVVPPPKLVDDAGAPRFAVLMRTNGQAAPLEVAFAAKKIPCRVIGETEGMWSSTQGKEFIAYLDAAEGHPTDDLCKVANKPKRYLKTSVVQRAVDNVAAGTEQNIIRALRYVPGNGSGPSKLAEDIERLSKLEWPRRCAEVSKLLCSGDLEGTEEVGDDEPDSDRNAIYKGLGFAATVLGSLQEIKRQIEAAKKTKKTSAVVEIATIHKIKGRGWDHIYLAGVDVGVMPHFKAVDLEEERRVFYVGATRAKKTLTICTSKASPFLVEMGLCAAPLDDDEEEREEEDRWVSTADCASVQKPPTVFVRRKGGEELEPLGQRVKVSYVCGMPLAGTDSECGSLGFLDVPLSAWRKGEAKVQCRSCTQWLDQSHLKER